MIESQWDQDALAAWDRIIARRCRYTDGIQGSPGPGRDVCVWLVEHRWLYGKGRKSEWYAGLLGTAPDREIAKILEHHTRRWAFAASQVNGGGFETRVAPYRLKPSRGTTKR